MRFQGRLEVERLKRRLDETFTRYSQLPSNTEVQSDYARYLCVLVAGYVEQAVQELTLERCRRQASPSVQRYASAQLRRLQNMNAEKLSQTLASFDPQLRSDVESAFRPELDALSTLVANRHAIAHGGSVGISYVRVKEAYDLIQTLIDWLVGEFDPPAAGTAP